MCLSETIVLCKVRRTFWLVVQIVKVKLSVSPSNVFTKTVYHDFFTIFISVPWRRDLKYASVWRSTKTKNLRSWSILMTRTKLLLAASHCLLRRLLYRPHHTWHPHCCRLYECTNYIYRSAKTLLYCPKNNCKTYHYDLQCIAGGCWESVCKIKIYKSLVRCGFKLACKKFCNPWALFKILLFWKVYLCFRSYLLWVMD